MIIFCFILESLFFSYNILLFPGGHCPLTALPMSVRDILLTNYLFEEFALKTVGTMTLQLIFNFSAPSLLINIKVDAHFEG